MELQGRLFSVEAKLEAIDQKLDLRAMTEAVLCIYTKKKIRNLAELLKSKHGLDQEDIRLNWYPCSILSKLMEVLSIA